MREAIAELRGKKLYRIFVALLVSNATSVLFLLARNLESGVRRYDFLLWNLFLAVVPLFLALWLWWRLMSSSWRTWQNIALSIGWILFLPNSYYLITDYIHLRETFEVNILYDVVMIMSFVLNGLIVGYLSLLIVHVELLKRIRRRDAHLIISLVLLACSFAIFLGRILRWNSWDLFLHPAGLLFDVSNQIIDPINPSGVVTTGSFFLMLGSFYIVVWNLTAYAMGPKR